MNTSRATQNEKTHVVSKVIEPNNNEQVQKGRDDLTMDNAPPVIYGQNSIVDQKESEEIARQPEYIQPEVLESDAHK